MNDNIYITYTTWYNILIELYNKYNIENKIKLENEKILNEFKIIPKKELVFNAFNHFEFDKLKVVIVGQDPYINTNQVMGLAFSVPDGVKVPPSLKNIYKCIENTCNINMNYNCGNLTKWAKQGILLLNVTLTIFEHVSNSHKKIWKGFGNDLIKYISDNSNGIIFLLWGNDAKRQKKNIDCNKHHILEHTHPSPLSRNPFIDCNHFIKTNAILIDNNKSKIDWKI